jgi:hypothetical protein
MTGNPKIDMAIGAILMVLLAASEALGQSKRLKPNGVGQFIAMFLAAGCRGVLNLGVSVSGGPILNKIEPVVEEAIKSVLDPSVAQGHQQEQPQSKG